jgi:hypothetical protein
MSDKILSRYTGKASGIPTNANVSEKSDDTEDFGAFGRLRGRERAIMLELRKKDGNILAIGYSWLERVEFDPSEGITLHFAGQKIKIKGRNLNGEARPNVRLFRGITRHKVPWIQEANGATGMQAGNDSTIIDKIEW